MDPVILARVRTPRRAHRFYGAANRARSPHRNPERQSPRETPSRGAERGRVPAHRRGTRRAGRRRAARRGRTRDPRAADERSGSLPGPSTTTGTAGELLEERKRLPCGVFARVSTANSGQARRWRHSLTQPVGEPLDLRCKPPPAVFVHADSTQDARTRFSVPGVQTGLAGR